VEREVFVAGFGARTPVGATASSSAAAVRAGIAMFAEHPYMVDKAGNRMVVARDALLSDDEVGVDRFIELGLPAALEALVPLTNLLSAKESLPLFIGLPAPRPGLPERLEEGIIESVMDKLQNQFRVGSIEMFSYGHSAGLMALEEGWRRIRGGTAEICLIGGIESYHNPETLEWLDDQSQLHSETNSWGFIPGEAAGFCLLCSSRAIERFGLRSFGQVRMVATAREASLIKTDAVCLGEGLTKAVATVLQSLPGGIFRVDCTICDLNGEPYRGDEFGYATVRTAGRVVDPSDLMTPADCWGDVGAASGPLFLTLALIAALKGYSKGPHTLVWTSSEGGHRTAALLYTGN